MPRAVGRICSKLLQFLAKHMSLSTPKTVIVGNKRHEGSDQCVSRGERFEVAVEAFEVAIENISNDEKMLITKKGKVRVVSNIDEMSGTFIKERKESFAN